MLCQCWAVPAMSAISDIVPPRIHPLCWNNALFNRCENRKASYGVNHNLLLDIRRWHLLLDHLPVVCVQHTWLWLSSLLPHSLYWNETELLPALPTGSKSWRTGSCSTGQGEETTVHWLPRWPAENTGGVQWPDFDRCRWWGKRWCSTESCLHKPAMPGGSHPHTDCVHYINRSWHSK